ncbi:MAG: integrase [Bacteroidota bacterium]|jgi:integrase/recombinase XerC
MIDSFLKYLAFEKRSSKHTITSYTNDLTQFNDFLGINYNAKPPENCDYQIIRTWIMELSQDELKARSINRKIACLRSFYKFLLSRGACTQNPMLKIKSLKTKKQLPVFVEEASITSLLDLDIFTDDFFGLRDKFMLEILYGTGIRLAELIGLTESSINLFEKTIRVLGKGNKERIIPIHHTLLKITNLYINSKKLHFSDNLNSCLFVTDTGNQLYPMFVYRKVIHYLGLITKQEKRSPHVLRHTFATHLLNKGADLNAIKDLLGHTSLAATQVYTHNSLDKLKAIFEQAHPKA